MNTRRSVRSTGATVAVAAAAVSHVQVTMFILIGLAALLATIFLASCSRQSGHASPPAAVPPYRCCASYSKGSVS